MEDEREWREGDGATGESAADDGGVRPLPPPPPVPPPVPVPPRRESEEERGGAWRGGRLKRARGASEGGRAGYAQATLLLTCDELVTQLKGTSVCDVHT